jgi:hypothetical protein
VMFIETSAKSGYNVKQVSPTIFLLFWLTFEVKKLLIKLWFYLKQLFRRVAAALPGMETNERAKEDSILFFIIKNSIIF